MRRRLACHFIFATVLLSAACQAWVPAAAQSVKDLMGKAQSQSDKRAVEGLIRQLQGQGPAPPPASNPAPGAEPGQAEGQPRSPAQAGNATVTAPVSTAPVSTAPVSTAPVPAVPAEPVLAPGPPAVVTTPLPGVAPSPPPAGQPAVAATPAATAPTLPDGDRTEPAVPPSSTSVGTDLSQTPGSTPAAPPAAPPAASSAIATPTPDTSAEPAAVVPTPTPTPTPASTPASTPAPAPAPGPPPRPVVAAPPPAMALPAAPPSIPAVPADAVDIARQQKLPTVDIEVYFDFNAATISKRALTTLDILGQALSDPRLSGATFLIAGHTDAKGRPDYNQRLSEARAAAVRSYLVTTFSIAEQRLVSRGYGESRLKNPKRPTALENRRVQIINWSSQLAR